MSNPISEQVDRDAGYIHAETNIQIRGRSSVGVYPPKRGVLAPLPGYPKCVSVESRSLNVRTPRHDSITNRAVDQKVQPLRLVIQELEEHLLIQDCAMQHPLI